MTNNNELERVWKEGVAGYLKDHTSICLEVLSKIMDFGMSGLRTEIQTRTSRRRSKSVNH
jgi:hypothetical protein